MRGDRKKQEERGKEEKDESLEMNKVIDIQNYKPKRIPQLSTRQVTLTGLTPENIQVMHIKQESGTMMGKQVLAL